MLKVIKSASCRAFFCNDKEVLSKKKQRIT